MIVLILLAFVGMLTGIFLILGMTPFTFAEELTKPLSGRQQPISKRIQQVNHPKEPKGIRKTVLEAREMLILTGKGGKFAAICAFSLFLAAMGAVICIVIQNYFMLPVLAAGMGLLPFWYVLFTSHSYKKLMNNEIETGLSSPYFPSDIDNYALEYFGSEQYYSDKFQDEAYLFIPFDENYYQAMAKVMEKRFANWQGQSFDEATLEPSDLAEAMMEYLDCECTYFPSLTDDDPIMSAYNYAKRESVKEGFVPVLIKADDEILWECLIMNSDPDSDGEDDFAFDPDKVAEYRKKMLSAPVENSKAVLEEMIGQRKEEAEDDDMDWDEEILGEMEGGYDNRRFSSYWNSDNNMTYPLILAKIPVKNPWEIFAYLPFGGWNECPNTPELMAVAKYWFEQHGAVPAAMSHDELEFLLPAPVPEEKAMDAAVELYGFCPDVIDQGPEDATVGALADVLRQSTVWYFWWD